MKLYYPGSLIDPMACARNCRIASVFALACILAGFVLPVHAAQAESPKLLMFEEDYCSWCARWNEEIGGIYHVTEQACFASLDRIQITEKLHDSIQLTEPVVYTPTFVLVHQNKEIGRITGYPGEDFFWYMLDDLIEDLPDSAREQASSVCQAS